MAYTDIDDPTIYFNTVLYTSNSGSSPRTISGVGFQPDWVWVKNRDSGDYNHVNGPFAKKNRFDKRPMLGIPPLRNM